MQMDEMTQQNGSLVEEATAASQAMAEGARELTRMMDGFVLPGQQAAAAPAAAASGHAERRNTNRPWSGQPQAAAPAETPKARAAVAGGDWQDF